MAKAEEIIIVVEREKLFESEKLHFQGTLLEEDKVKVVLKNLSDNYKVMRRGSVDEDVPLEQCAERNENFKQPIPYIVISKEGKYFATERLEGAGESRLHGKLSMGIGGHMNAIVTADGFDGIILENTTRELHEELHVVTGTEQLEINMIGLLNDDSNEVGKLHIGLLGELELKESQSVTVREVDQLKGNWFTLEELNSPEVYPRIESWGQIYVDLLGKLNK